jgi:urocanate hydratase
VGGTHAVRHTTPVGRTIALEGIAVGLVLRGETPQSGYVAERDRTEPDVTAIAAPIRRPGGVAAALSLLGPTYRISDDTMHAYGRIVAAEAERISALLGTAPPEAPGESE